MEYLVVSEVEIDGNKVEHFTSISLRQRFNEHHEFVIRISHDVLESFGTFSLDNTKKLIGKTAIIRFLTKAQVQTLAYEFKGIICELGTSKSNTDNGDLILKGYSPTILLEDGEGYASYNNKTLKDIFTKASKNFEQSDCQVNINTSLTSPINYVVRYKESNFHFLNRLSRDYGELLYYDGMALNFGQPTSMNSIEIVSGEDMSNMKLTMRVSPIEAWNYAYASKKNEYITTRGSDIQGMDPYPKHVVDVSNSLYSELDDVPLYQPVSTTDEAENLVQKNKEATAAGLVMLTGTTIRPELTIGCVANVQISRLDGQNFVREDLGNYLVTAVNHQFSQNGSYYNSFEALSGWVKGIPVRNIVNPMAEPQFGWVVDNKDPDKLGRVKVQMQWQKDDEKTDWIWVMTPDAGGGKDGARGGGLMVMPEKGDRVLIGFVLNNPDRPFVMGSLWHGKSAPDGSLRCLTSRRSGAKVCINDADGSINIEDGGGHSIKLDGAGKITITAANEISLQVGSSYIVIKPSEIGIKSGTVEVEGTTEAALKKGSNFFMARGSQVYMKGSTATVEGDNAELKGNTKAKVDGPQVEVNGTAKTEIKGGIVDINA